MTLGPGAAAAGPYTTSPNRTSVPNAAAQCCLRIEDTGQLPAHGDTLRRLYPVAIVATAISACAGMIVVFWGSSEAATYTWFIGAGLAFALYMIGSRMFGQKANYPTLDDSMVAAD